jgi:hypothetical protein
MNTLTEEFNSAYADVDDEVAEKADQPKAPVAATSHHPMIVKPLSGYESIMRRHAASWALGKQTPKPLI